MTLFIIVLGFVTAAVVSSLTSSRRVIEGAAIAASVFALGASSAIAYAVGTSGAYKPLAFLSVDALGAIVMLLISVVASSTSIYAVPFLRKEMDKKVIGLSRFKQYYVLVNIFLAMMFLAVTANNPVVAWIFLEATTLSTVFLISYYGKRSSVEAAWKYLIINSLGLLLAFFGTLLYFAAIKGIAANGFVSWQALLDNARHFDPAVAKVAFVFVLIGYGTKIGLAPMHTWKPDAYSKSPVPLGALFSGALMPVAFVILLRFKSITDAAVGPLFSQHLLIAFGILSIIIAALSMLSAKNYKRLLAYSSIEHAGIIALGFGFGGLGAFAAILHMIYHSLIKPALFFTSGNILLKYHSARITKVRGAMSIVPVTSVLLLVGLFAVTGLPPFGIFQTELFILAAGAKNSPIIVVTALLAMAMVFIGFFRHVSSMVLSGKPETPQLVESGEDSVWLFIPPLVLLVLALVLSVWMPPFVQTLIHETVRNY
ncbi:MAG: proton-conducting transporter membrane subunit [Patescibacteria group bacterium]